MFEVMSMANFNLFSSYALNLCSVGKEMSKKCTDGRGFSICNYLYENLAQFILFFLGVFFFECGMSWSAAEPSV